MSSSSPEKGRKKFIIFRDIKLYFVANFLEMIINNIDINANLVKNKRLLRKQYRVHQHIYEISRADCSNRIWQSPLGFERFTEKKNDFCSMSYVKQHSLSGSMFH
jgi:hypothetical protein